MTELISEYYLWVKALHIISIIAWMAGLLYLPRLFVYHADAAPDSENAKTFIIMERRLLRAIMNPAMIASWLSGILMIVGNPYLFDNGWMHVKFSLVIVMSIVHMVFSRIRKNFEAGKNEKSHTYYRFINEIPTILMIIIVVMAVAEPF
jgi:putative membrane protein